MWLRTPVEVSRAQLDHFEMSGIVGTNQTSYAGLLRRIEQLQDKLATASTAERPTTERHLKGVLATLRNVQLLATAENVRARVLSRRTTALAGGALIAAAASVFCLATVPKTKPAPAAAAGASVVSVTLTEAGAKKLGCPTATFNALKLGGSATEPQVLPLGGVKCTAGDYLTLKVAEKEGLATGVEALEPVSATPTSSPRVTPVPPTPTITVTTP